MRFREAFVPQTFFNRLEVWGIHPISVWPGLHPPSVAAGLLWRVVKAREGVPSLGGISPHANRFVQELLGVVRERPGASFGGRTDGSACVAGFVTARSQDRPTA